MNASLAVEDKCGMQQTVVWQTEDALLAFKSATEPRGPFGLSQAVVALPPSWKGSCLSRWRLAWYGKNEPLRLRIGAGEQREGACRSPTTSLSTGKHLLCLHGMYLPTSSLRSVPVKPRCLETKPAAAVCGRQSDEIPARRRALPWV